MSKTQPHERRASKRRPTAGIAEVAAPTPPDSVKPVKLARGTRDALAPLAVPIAARVDVEDIVDADVETIVVDPDDPIELDALDALDLDGDDDSIDRHMLEV